MLHIVFQQDDVQLLKEAIKLDESLQGEVFEIKDEWGVGPLKDLDTEEGWNTRQNWWREMLIGSPYGEKLVGTFDDRETVKLIKEKLDADESLEAWIWMGQNQHDVCSYYWLMSQLKDHQSRIFVLYLNNLPFINEKGGIFYPTALHEIQPKEFLKAKKLARPITLSEFEVDPDEWKKLCTENGGVRILEGGKKIVSKEVDFYDKDILSAMNAEPQRLNKVLGNMFSKMKIKTGDVFLVWRIREMINAGKLEATGDWNKGWKEITIRLAGTPVVAETITE